MTVTVPAPPRVYVTLPVGTDAEPLVVVVSVVFVVLVAEPGPPVVLVVEELPDAEPYDSIPLFSRIKRRLWPAFDSRKQGDRVVRLCVGQFLNDQQYGRPRLCDQHHEHH